MKVGDLFLVFIWNDEGSWGKTNVQTNEKPKAAARAMFPAISYGKRMKRSCQMAWALFCCHEAGNRCAARFPFI